MHLHPLAEYFRIRISAVEKRWMLKKWNDVLWRSRKNDYKELN